MTESTSDGSTLWRRAMLATRSLTVALDSGSAFGAGGGVGAITFSGTTREVTTAARIRRPLRASARTTVVLFGVAVTEAPCSSKTTKVITHSLKQKLIT